MSATTIRYDVHDGLATITLARPDKRNAMNLDLFRELGDAATEASGDQSVRAILVEADGPSFSAGIDLEMLAAFAASGDTRVRFAELVVVAQRPYRALIASPKPSVAAVRGHAIGAGFQLALACDLRVAADDASFAMLEVRYGLVPDLGGNHRLARTVGLARAKELEWTGRAVGAEEAERIGMVNRVIPTERLGEEAAALAGTLASGPPIALSRAKALIEGAFVGGIEEHMDAEAEAQRECFGSKDQKEAVAAYLERRPARFAGR